MILKNEDTPKYAFCCYRPNHITKAKYINKYSLSNILVARSFIDTDLQNIIDRQSARGEPGIFNLEVILYYNNYIIRPNIH